MTIDVWPLLVRLSISLRRIRPVLGLGLLATVLGAAGFLWVHELRSRHVQQLQDALRSASAALRNSSSDRVASVDPRAQAVADFEARLGDSAQVPAGLRRVFTLARQSGLDLTQGEYRWQVDEAAQSERLVMQLAVKGSYVALRAFLDEVLTQLPFVSLDDCSLRRDAASESAVSANVRISMHLKPGPATAQEARRSAVPVAGTARTPAQGRVP